MSLINLGEYRREVAYKTYIQQSIKKNSTRATAHTHYQHSFHCGKVPNDI